MGQEKWQIELYESGTWLMYSFCGVVLACWLIAWGLRRTVLGQQLVSVIRPSIYHADRRKLILLLGILLLLVLLEVRISVLNTFFYNGLYSSLQNKALQAFWFFAGINALLMGVKIIHAILDEWLSQVFMIRWLERLNQALTSAWLGNRNYYRLHMRRHSPDNMDQRIQQDAQEFIASTVEVVRGTINALVSVVEFSVILWGLSGVLNLMGFEIARGMVVFIYAFILAATLISVWIGHPLVRLNFYNEQFNGNYRYALIRVRDHAESIAFYRGEAPEQANLQQHFRAVIRNRWQIVYRSLGLNGFNTGITQLSNLLPLMLQEPRFFAGQVTLGDMHQTVQAFNRLQRALSFFRNFYESFTAYQARLERLYGFFASMKTMPPLSKLQIHQSDDADAELRLQAVRLLRHDGQALMNPISLHVNRSESVLLQGPSGVGKTSLLRAIAGLWPFACEGVIHMPSAATVMFVPQRAYMPQGSLRQAILYPQGAQMDEQTLILWMKRCRLGAWVGALDQQDDWQHKLSPGELQRIAFIRVFLQRPRLVLLDEATSALDESTQAHLYQLLRTHLPECMVLSVGHRSTLQTFHDRVIELQAD